MNSKLWDNFENTLQKFYNENVYHSDLNAKNIIIDNTDNFYFLDFDNSYFFYKKELFLKSLNRLDRSLSKMDNYKNEMKNIIKNLINNLSFLKNCRILFNNFFRISNYVFLRFDPFQ